MSTYEKLYGYIIKLYDSEYPSGNIIEVYRWSGYKFHQFCKWRWYFEYRVALLRVRHPRKYINHSQFTEPLTKKAESEILRNKIISKKGQITKTKNIIAISEEHWNSLFPIQEDDRYKQAMCKLKRLEKELQNLKIKQHDKNIRQIRNGRKSPGGL